MCLAVSKRPPKNNSSNKNSKNTFIDLNYDRTSPVKRPPLVVHGEVGQVVYFEVGEAVERNDGAAPAAHAKQVEGTGELLVCVLVAICMRVCVCV